MASLEAKERMMEAKEKEVTAKEKKTEELKRKLEASLDKHQAGSGRNKRFRSANLWDVTENQEVGGWLKTLFRTIVWDKSKFLANEQELDEVMFNCLMLTQSVATRLEKLEEDEQETMVRRYSVVYGMKCTKVINDKRNGWQQDVKKVHMALLKEGKAFTSKQLLHVAQRLDLKFYDEAHEDEAKAVEDKVKNLKTQRYRDRFGICVDRYMPQRKGAKVWTFEKRNPPHLHRHEI